MFKFSNMTFVLLFFSPVFVKWYSAFDVKENETTNQINVNFILRVMIKGKDSRNC